jgi:hypothetical protein
MSGEALRGWYRETDRLRPEILRDPVAYALAHIAENQVFPEYEHQLAELREQNAIGQHQLTELRSLGMSQLAELRAENARLKAALDRHGTHKVHIVPQGLALADAIDHLPDARPGDRLRFQAGADFVLAGDGVWRQAE